MSKKISGWSIGVRSSKKETNYHCLQRKRRLCQQGGTGNWQELQNVSIDLSMPYACQKIHLLHKNMNISTLLL